MAPLARESSSESFFHRIVYRSFSFSKVSKSSTTATKYSKYKVKKVQILESISREQDVMSSLMTYYYISHALLSGRIFRSKATLRNQVLKHMTKKQVFDLCLKGANNMVFFAYSRHTHRVNEEEECFSFSCSVMFSINLSFTGMLLWYGLRKGKTLNALEVSHHAYVCFLEINNTEGTEEK